MAPKTITLALSPHRLRRLAVVVGRNIADYECVDEDEDIARDKRILEEIETAMDEHGVTP